MSFGVSFRVDVRPYTGYDDPSLPIAAWISQGGVAGDASGGVLTMTFLFQRDDDARVTELFNLEQISIDTDANADDEFLLRTVNMDNLAQNRPASPQMWSLIVEGIPSVNMAALRDRSPALPLWIGAPNQDEGDVGLRIQVTNTDLRLYAVTLQGYMWGPRSVLAPGGPRRPVGGLFGTG